MHDKGVLVEITHTDIPLGHRAINTIWRFQVKSDSEGRITRFRSRLVALGNHHKYGIDYHKTFSPVTRMTSFRLLLSLAAKLDLKLYAGDFSTAYLNANLTNKQYLKNIPGFPCSPGHVWMVDKTLYGLHQSGRE